MDVGSLIEWKRVKKDIIHQLEFLYASILGGRFLLCFLL